MILKMLCSLCLCGAVELEDIVSEFKEAFPEVVVSDSLISLYDFGNNRQAKCDHNPNRISINLSWWENEKNVFLKKKVVFHELGHCVLDLRHPQNLNDETIMNIKMNTAKSDGSNWGELVEELQHTYAAARYD